MSFSWQNLPSPRPIVLGHRGARHAHTENTLEAFQAALDEGALGTEFDVLLSADGIPMVFHDPTLLRMTGNRDGRRVGDLTASELETIQLEGGHKIPRLGAVLDWAMTQGALLNIELKSESPLLDPIARVVASLLDDYSEAPDFVLMSSFHPTLVRQFAQLKPTVGAALLVDKNHPCLMRDTWLRATKSVAVHPHAALILEQPQLLARVSGSLVNTWTVNDEQQALRLRELGVTALISDRPGAILAALNASAI